MSSFSERLHRVIPGGAHTYSRGDDQYPANAPEILVSGKGAYVTAADGRTLLDYGMGLRAVTLGYADERINRAASELSLRPARTDLGCSNLAHMIGIVRRAGLPAVVAINRFPDDTEAEIEAVRKAAKAAGASGVEVIEAHGKGGAGAEAHAIMTPSRTVIAAAKR